MGGVPAWVRESRGWRACVGSVGGVGPCVGGVGPCLDGVGPCVGGVGPFVGGVGQFFFLLLFHIIDFFIYTVMNIR